MHKTLMPITAIRIDRSSVHPFTHTITIESASHVFQAAFEFPEGKIWLEPKPLAPGIFFLRMDISGFSSKHECEMEMGHFLQAVAEAVHFFMKLHRGNFIYFLKSMEACVRYFGQVYERIIVSPAGTVTSVHRAPQKGDT